VPHCLSTVWLFVVEQMDRVAEVMDRTVEQTDRIAKVMDKTFFAIVIGYRFSISG